MHIGLIGGIGPAATGYYYRQLFDKFSLNNKILEMTIAHADNAHLLRNLEANDVISQVSIYEKLTKRLSDAGANCVAITAIAGHFCINEFKKISVLPVIDMLSCIEQTITKKRFKKIGLMGTKKVMESKFYSSISSAEVVIPRKELLNKVHMSYIEMVKLGLATKEHKHIFDLTCRQFIDEMNVDAVMLGGTDFSLVYSANKVNFEIIDCVKIHVDYIYDYVNY